MKKALEQSDRIEFLDTVEETCGKLPDKALFVVDSGVFYKTLSLANHLRGKSVLLLTPSETEKTLRTVEKIYGALFDGPDLRAMVVIGGGIVGDLAAFAAATYKRGIPLTLVPTTLLSMADSAVGGKNGVNYRGVKNYIGTFRKPDHIYICPAFLKTLSRKELRSGLGELLKYGLIGDEEILRLLAMAPENIQELPYLALIQRGLVIKSRLVAEDFHDVGVRNILNFGHNIGHALENATQGDLAHGEAVALGLLVELRLSEMLLQLDPSLRKNLTGLMDKFGMPTKIEGISGQALLPGLRKDKKNDDQLRFTLLERQNQPRIKVPVPEEAILQAWQDLMEKK